MASLAEKFLAGTATEAEKEQLHRLYDGWRDDEELVSSDAGQAEVVGQEILQAIRDRIREQDRDRTSDPVIVDQAGERTIRNGVRDQQRTAIPLYRKKVWRWAAAACVVALTGGLSLYYYRAASKNGAVVSAPAIHSGHSSVAQPGKDRATLTLADGSVVDLDSSGTGRLAEQGNTSIKIGDGKIMYDPNKAGGTEVVYNTITTPRGGQYQVVLPDGTKVWLNATSYIKFPVTFTGSSRVVEVSGEAYFEVAKNPSMPFVAKVKGVEVEVLGTHFNVMAYGEEGKIATTLLEGSVRVSRGKEKYAIVPGQQAVWKEDGDFNLNTDVDLEEVVAWKNGKFQFNNADVKTIMRQIARWYDVDVEYENVEADTRLGGIVSRKADIRQLLDYFELTGKVKFKVEGNKIIVSK
jgi:ferric-dicitrate binding protein FerR (iron transport regulator)